MKYTQRRDNVQTPCNDFADWWNSRGGFLLPPEPLEIYNIDVAATCVIFRHGRFQVEQYLLFPNSGAGEHGHPNLDTVVNGYGNLFNKNIFSTSG